MKNDWSIANEIQKRAQLESLYSWSLTDNPPLPRTEKTEKVKLTAGLINFAKDIKRLINEFAI